LFLLASPGGALPSASIGFRGKTELTPQLRPLRKRGHFLVPVRAQHFGFRPTRQTPRRVLLGTSRRRCPLSDLPPPFAPRLAPRSSRAGAAGSTSPRRRCAGVRRSARRTCYTLRVYPPGLGIIAPGAFDAVGFDLVALESGHDRRRHRRPVRSAQRGPDVRPLSQDVRDARRRAGITRARARLDPGVQRSLSGRPEPTQQ